MTIKPTCPHEGTILNDTSSTSTRRFSVDFRILVDSLKLISRTPSENLSRGWIRRQWMNHVIFKHNTTKELWCMAEMEQRHLSRDRPWSTWVVQRPKTGFRREPGNEDQNWVKCLLICSTLWRKDLELFCIRRPLLRQEGRLLNTRKLTCIDPQLRILRRRSGRRRRRSRSKFAISKSH